MTQPSKDPRDMTMQEMLRIPWVRKVHAGLIALAALVVIFGIAVILTGCTVSNLPQPIPVTPPSGASAASTLPSPTTTAPLVTPRTTAQSSTATPTEPIPTTSQETAEASSTTSATSSANPPPLTAADVSVITADVQSVYDGDTLTVVIEGEKESVRPLGMDAPERDNPNIGVTGECYAEQSGDALRALLTGSQVQLIVDPAQGDANDDYRDEFGRLLRYVEVGDQPTIKASTTFIDISQYQIANGNAWVYEQYPVARTPLYRIAMAHAQDVHNGLWLYCE